MICIFLSFIGVFWRTNDYRVVLCDYDDAMMGIISLAGIVL